MVMSMYGCGYNPSNLVIDCLEFIGHSNSLNKCLVLIARVDNGCTYGSCLDFVVKGYQQYLQEFRTLDFVKHPSIREVKEDGSHGEETGQIGYRR